MEFRKISISVRSEEILPVLTVELTLLPSELLGKRTQKNLIQKNISSNFFKHTPVNAIMIDDRLR
jgi:hypothetical protein